MLPVPLGGLAAQEGAALFVFFGAQILKKIQNGHNTNHGFVADFTQSPKIFSVRQGFTPQQLSEMNSGYHRTR